MTDTRVILASTSQYRRELLSRILCSFETVDPEVDERPQQETIAEPARLASTLAQLKAESVARRHPHAVVIGSDQVACLDDRILGKPGNSENACSQLRLMSGQTHQLFTAVCVIAPDRTVEFSNTTHLTMRELTCEQILRYVERDQPVHCAGSYMIEAGGIALFSAVETTDFTAITGLPLIELSTTLLNLRVNLL